MKKKSFFVGLLFFGAVSLFAESSVQLKSEVGPKDGYIGDVINVRFTLTHPVDATPTNLTLDNKIGEFEVLGSSVTSNEKEIKNKIVTSYLIKLTVFSTGTQTIPTLSLPIKLIDGTTTQINTDPIQIQIKSLLAEKGDEGNLRPLKGFINFKSYFWLIVTLLILLVFLIIFISYKKLRKKFLGGIDDSIPTVPAFQTAEELLEKLQNSDLINQGKIKEFYSQLSVIFRGYLEGHYGLSAMDRTSSEILHEIKKLNLVFSLTNPVREFLDRSDLVKFAKLTPDVEEIHQDFLSIKEFVAQTKPKVALTPEGSVKEDIPV